MPVLRGRYRPVEFLGRGGFGRTYRAVDSDRMGASCVIKQFAPQSQGSTFQEAARLFNREAEQLLNLGQHAQIPTLFAYFESELQRQGNQYKYLYLVQEFVDGQNLLDELLKVRPFSERKIQELLSELLPVLQFIHKQGVIHRDIKPENIMRRNSDRKLVLIDFGISKELSGTILAQGAQGTICGTPGYAPSEQMVRGEAYPASDLYALGVTCIHLLTGTHPIKLYDTRTGRWQWQEQLSQQGLKISPELEEVLNKLLKDLVKNRYQSAEGVLKDLAKPTPPPPPQPKNPWRCVRTVQAHATAVYSVAISPDGQIMASGSADKTVKLWQLDTGKEICTFKGHSDQVWSVAFKDRQTLASGSGDNTIKIWQVGAAESIRTLEGHSGWVRAVAFSPDGQTLASGSSDTSVKIWSLQGGFFKSLQQMLFGGDIFTLPGHSNYVFSVAFSPDGQMLASGSQDCTIKLWDLGTRQEIRKLEGHNSWVRSLAFSPDGKILASGSSDRTVKLWDLAAGRNCRTLSGHSDYVFSLAFSPDGQILASSSSDTTVKLWLLAAGREICTLTGHSSAVGCVAFSPDGQTLVSGSGDGTVKLWRRDSPAGPSGSTLQTVKV